MTFDQVIDSVRSPTQILFASILLLAQVMEIYLMLAPPSDGKLYNVVRKWCAGPIRIVKTTKQTAHDFTNGIYYNPWVRRDAILIRSPDHMLHLAEAPELSQRAVYSDIFGFGQNLSHTRVQLVPNEDFNTTRYRLFSRAIRVVGGRQLPVLQWHIQTKITKTIEDSIASQQGCNDWVPVKLAPLMRQVATGTLALYVFGASLTSDPDFVSAMHGYYNDIMKSMGALQFCPNVLKPYVYNLVTNRGAALHDLFKHMRPIVTSQGEKWDEEEPLKSVTLLHNMMNLSKESVYWTPDMLMQAMVGIWFAASHQPWVNLHCIFLELCERPEYIHLLRAELDAQKELGYSTLSKLPILDSFAKESARLNPLDKMSIRRKALRPFGFPNGGPHVPAGRVVCMPASEFMHEESKYPNAHTFDGLRFVQDPSAGHTDDMRGTQFTDPSRHFPIWGLGSKACPGRFHASLVMKLAIAHIVQCYDFRLEEPNARNRWYWETYMMPHNSTRVLFKKRESAPVRS